MRDLGVWANGNPGGVDAADLRSSAGFLPPPSMLKGRNQPEGTADAEAAACVEAAVPACMHKNPDKMWQDIA